MKFIDLVSKAMIDYFISSSLEDILILWIFLWCFLLTLEHYAAFRFHSQLYLLVCFLFFWASCSDGHWNLVEKKNIDATIVVESLN